MAAPTAKSAVSFLHMSKLKNGVEMPTIGLGTWQVRGADARKSVLAGIKIGYRHIDTAAIYGNEEEVAAGISESGVARENLWITSKLSAFEQGYESALSAFATSIKKLNTDYLDLYLIHWPGMARLRPDSPEHFLARKESWRALEELYNAGKIRSIGVSNYTKKHLEEMESYANVMPHVNQVEFHPYLHQVELLNHCNKKGILLEAYSSLGTGDSGLLHDHVIVKIAHTHKRTAAQILLRWALQQGIPVIPKSTHEERIKQNLDVFDFSLTEEEMRQIGSLNKNKHFCWDPTLVL